MEDELRDIDRRYHELFDNATDLIITIDLDGTILSANPAITRMSGYTSEEVIGKNVSIMLSDENLQLVKSMIAAKLNGTERTFYEAEMIAREGRIIPIEISSVLLYKDGEPYGTQAIVRDISTRKLHEKIVREHSEMLQQTLDAASSGSWDWNLKSGAVTFSDKWIQGLGYTRKEVKPHISFRESITHPDDMPRAMSSLSDHFEERTEYYDCENRLRTKDGKYRWSHVRGRVIERDEEGNPVRMVGADTDITDQMEMIKELRESNQRFENLFDNANDGIFIIDCDTKLILDANEMACKSLGYTKSELKGKPVLDIYFAEDSGQNIGFMDMVVNNGSGVFESEHRKKDGSRLPVEISCRVIQIGERKVFQSFARIITERKESEQRLRDSEKQYRNLVETSQDLIWEVDSEGCFTYLNPAWEKSHGYKIEEMIGRPFSDFVTEEQLKKDLEVFDDILEGKDSFGYETTHVSKSGEPINLVFNAIIHRDSAGNATGTLGTAHDITRKKKLETEAEKRNAYIRLLYDIALKSNEAKTPEEIMKFCVDKVCEFIKWPVGHVYCIPEKLAKTLTSSTIWHLEDKERFKEFHDITMKTSFEKYIGLPGRVLVAKKAVWIRDVNKDDNFPRAKLADNIGVESGFAFPVLVGETVEAVLEFFSPETQEPDEELLDVMQQVGIQIGRVIERDRAEKARLEYQDSLELRVVEGAAEVQKLFNAIEQYDEMVVIANRNGVIEYANPATEKITGYTRKELTGKTPAILNAGVHGDEFFKNMWDTVLRGNIWQGNITNKKKSGELYEEEMTISPVKGDEGKITHFVAIKRDITQRRQNEVALNLAKEEAERANTAKSVFLSSMSHELRTPLNSILGFSQLLATDTRNPLTDLQQGSLKRILGSGKHLLDLIDEVLDLSKIEAGKLAVMTENVEALPIVRDVIAGLEPIAERRGIKISNNANERGVYIKVDMMRFRQVILNLLSNAVKYNVDNGDVTVRLEKLATNELRISVTDSGTGIPDEKMDFLFEPFARLGAETSSIEGTGIGLTITKKLVEAMSGKIGVESEAGKGSMFYVDFPLGEKPEIKTGTTGPVAGYHHQPGSGKIRTVLYIEDNLSNLSLMESILERRPNITMISALNARVGIELALDKKPDLILLDINLPDMDGYQVLQELRSHSETENTQIIALSANAMPDEDTRGESVGFSHYITKPVNIGGFLKIIDNTLT